MQTLTKHFKQKNGTLAFVITCLLIAVQSVQAQMELTLKLPKSAETTIQIIRIGGDGVVQPLLNETTSEKVVTLDIPLSREVLELNPVLQYNVTTADGKDHKATFPGINETLEIDLRSDRTYYARNGRFAHYAKILTSIDHPSVQMERAHAELSKLGTEYPESEYVEYLIYSGYISGILTQDDLASLLAIHDPEAFWLSKIGEYDYEKEQVLRNFFDTLGYHATRNDRVMLKFWGTWCKPCVADNVVLKDIHNSGAYLPVILGVQRDNELAPDLFYSNVLDAKGMIAKHFQITAYPTYVIIKGSDVLLRTHRLEEALTQ